MSTSFAPVGAEMLISLGLTSPDGPGQELKARGESRGVSVEGRVVGGSVKPGHIEGASDGDVFIATILEQERSSGRVEVGGSEVGGCVEGVAIEESEEADFRAHAP